MRMIFDTTETLSEAAAAFFIGTAQEAIAAKGSFFVALSGGSTPKAMFEKLAAARDIRIDWDKIYFFWGDERFVPNSDPQSNYKMTRDALLSHVPANHVFPVPFAETPALAAEAYENILHDFFPALPRFDLCFLGMGTDGHTASLFPGSEALEEKSRWVSPSKSMAGGPERITMTYPVLNHAAKVCFLVAGKDKAETLKNVLKAKASEKTLPAAQIKPDSGTLLWMIDKAAASLL